MSKKIFAYFAVLLIACISVLMAQDKAAPNNQSGTPTATDAIPVIPGVAEIKGPNRGETRIAREVRHELLTIPYYTLFDDLRYRVNGSEVELLGQVTNPVVKTDAVNSVKKIEGVENVVDHIEVLPPSPNDDRIRQQVARAVFDFDGLSRYGWEAAPSIHIIVNNGNVRLTGVVSSQADKNAAGIKANGVPGVFSVQNELLVAS